MEMEVVKKGNHVWEVVGSCGGNDEREVEAEAVAEGHRLSTGARS